MTNNFSEYKREPAKQNAQVNEFAQYKRGANSSEIPNSSPNQGLFNRVDRNLLIGLANLGQTAANLPRNLVNLVSPETAQSMPKSSYDFAQAFNQPYKETSDILTQMGAEIAPSFLIPGANFGRAGQLISKIPGLGKYINAGLSEAVPQTAFAAMQALENSPENAGEIAALTGGLSFPLGAANKAVQIGSPALKLAARGTLGAAGGYAGHELGGLTGIPAIEDTGSVIGAILGARGINVNKNAKKTVFEGLNPDDAKKLVEASRRLGLDFITPGEAIENPFLAGEHARIGKTREGAKELYAAGKNRVVSEEQAIMKLFDDIYTEGKLAPEKQRLYEIALDTPLPDEVALDFMESSTIENAMKHLKKDPIYKDLLTNKN